MIIEELADGLGTTQTTCPSNKTKIVFSILYGLRLSFRGFLSILPGATCRMSLVL